MVAITILIGKTFPVENDVVMLVRNNVCLPVAFGLSKLKIKLVHRVMQRIVIEIKSPTDPVASLYVGHILPPPHYMIIDDL